MTIGPSIPVGLLRLHPWHGSPFVRGVLSLEDFDVAAELGSMGAIKQAVKEGHGVSFVSELAIRDERRAGDLQVARVRELGLIRRTYHSVVSRRRMLSPVTQAFLEYLRDASVDPDTAQPSAKRKAQDKTPRK